MSTNNSSEQNREKRKKLNDDNSCMDMDIDITQLGKKTIPQLKEISLSIYGISIKSGKKKNEIIEQIKAIHKRKQDTIERQAKVNNVNSFNKEPTKFKVKDGVGPNEWSFWKVFRSKIIFKRIMSYMDKQFSIAYDSIILVSKMLNSNHTSMIRDKVNRNQYLTFGNLEELKYDKNNDIFRIFSTFKKNTSENILFFKQFFKYFKMYILRFNRIEMKHQLTLENNHREQLANEIIEAKCLPALQTLIQYYQYIPTESNLKHAIYIGSTKMIKFILQQQPQLKQSIANFLNTISTYTSEFRNYYLELVNSLTVYKSLYYLHCQKVIDMSTPTNNSILYQHIQSCKNQVNETISLKTLATIGKLILLSNRNENNSIIKYQEIESFSKHELKLPLSDPTLQIQYKKDTIKKLLDLYYSVIFSSIEQKPEFYHLYFSGNGSELSSGGTIVEFNKSDLSFMKQFKQSFQFANLSLLKHCLQNSASTYYYEQLEYLTLGLNSNGIPKNDDMLFSHCIGESNSHNRLKFVSSILSDVNGIINNGSNIIKLNGINEIGNLFVLLVGYDDVELVKYLTPTLKNNSSYHFNLGRKIIPFIKSIKMLDYLFENHNNLISKEGIEIWKFRNLHLLKHYESLNKFQKIKVKDLIEIINLTNNNQFTNNYLLPNASIEILSYIIEKGSSNYEINPITVGSLFSSIKDNNTIDDHVKFEMIKLLSTNFQLPKIYCFEYTTKPSYTIPRFLNWLFINHKNYLKSICIVNSKFDKYQDGIPVEVYYLTGRYDQVIDYISSFSFLMDNYFENIDINILDFICDKIKNLNIIHANLFTSFSRMIEKLIINGRLDLLEHIQHNHNWLFNISKSNKTSFNSSIFTIKELKSFLLKSLASNNLEVSRFLFEFIDLSFGEYSRNGNSLISKSYFKFQ